MSDSERDHMESYNRVRNGAPPTTGPFYIHPGAPNGSQYRNGHPVTPVTPAMTPLVGPYTRFAPYRQQSTQVLLDRVRKITLAKEEAAATKKRAQTTPQMFVRRAVLSGLPVSRTPPTLKDMIVQAFNDLKPKCPRGIRFPRLLDQIRHTFPISTTMNISLEYHVDKALNDMMRKGVVSQAYGSLPMQGTYLLLQDPASGHGLNLTVTGRSLASTQASTARPGHALPGPNSHITQNPATGGSRGTPSARTQTPGQRRPDGRIQTRVDPFSIARRIRATDPRMFTKSFGARAGKALKDDVSQRPNTPNVVDHHISFGNILDDDYDAPGLHLSESGSMQGLYGSPPPDTTSPTKLRPDNPEPWAASVLYGKQESVWGPIKKPSTTRAIGKKPLKLSLTPPTELDQAVDKMNQMLLATEEYVNARTPKKDPPVVEVPIRAKVSWSSITPGPGSDDDMTLSKMDIASWQKSQFDNGPSTSAAARARWAYQDENVPSTSAAAKARWAAQDVNFAARARDIMSGVLPYHHSEEDYKKGYKHALDKNDSTFVNIDDLGYEHDEEEQQQEDKKKMVDRVIGSMRKEASVRKSKGKPVPKLTPKRVSGKKK